MQATLLAGVLALWTGPARTAEIDEEARAMGRLIERELEKNAKGTAVSKSLQWAYIPGTGLIYFVGIHVKLSPAEKSEKQEENEIDRTWKDAMKEVRGDPRVSVPSVPASVRKAIDDAIRNSIGRYQSKVSCLEPGESIRLIAYEGGAAALTAHPWVEMQIREKPDAANRLANLLTIGGRGSGAHTNGAYVVYAVPPDGGEPEVIYHSDLLAATDGPDEDLAIFRQILEKRLRNDFRDEFWGRDMGKRPGTLAFNVDGVGPILAANLAFSVSKVSMNDIGEWEKARREVRGEATRAVLVRSAEAGKVTGTIREIMAEFSTKIRDLKPTDTLTVLVYASQGGHLIPFNLFEGKDPWDHDVYLHNLRDFQRANDAPIAIVRAKGEDIEAMRKGSLDKKSFLEKIEVILSQTGTASVGGSDHYIEIFQREAGETGP